MSLPPGQDPTGNRYPSVAVCLGITDNPRTPPYWNVVQNQSPDTYLCVHGSSPCSDAWLASTLAQVADTVGLVLCGSCANLAGYPQAHRLADLAEQDIETLAMHLGSRFPGATLLLVRSDAGLPALALARLQRALSQADVLAAGALDNLCDERSPLPAGLNSDAPTGRIDAVCYAYSRRLLIDCTSVSALASAWHGRRLATWLAAGGKKGIPERGREWRRVTLDHVYVGATGQALAGAAGVSDPRDPLPPSPLAELRNQVAAALGAGATPGSPGLDARPVILHVLHGWGGGAERWVRDFCSAFDTARHLVLIARGSHARRCHGEWLELHDGSRAGPPLRRVALPCPIADTVASDPTYRRLLREWIAEYCVDAIVVSSLIGHSLDALGTGLPTVRIIHDHYPLWPVLHRDFSDERLRFDDNQRVADLSALGPDREFSDTDPGHWKSIRDASVSQMLAARVQLIAPSQSALSNDLRLAPEMSTLRTAVIPHGLSAWPDGSPRSGDPPPRERLRLVIPGRVRRGKGAQLLEKVLPRLREHADIFLLGAGSDAHSFFGQNGVHVVLDYQRDDLPELLSRLGADAAVLMPTVAETFGYMLSELRDFGLPVIATRMGAYVERIDDGVDGFLVEANADAIVARIAELAGDRRRLHAVRSRLKGRREMDLASMAHAYAAALELPTVEALRYPLSDPGSTDLELMELLTDRNLAREQAAALAAKLEAALTESHKRGAWGHSLDRELAQLRVEFEERSSWALSLNEEVEQLRPIAMSRFWRYTWPLRRTLQFLRDQRASWGYRRHHLINQVRRLRGSLARHGVRGTWNRLLRELGGTSRNVARETWPEPGEDFSPFPVPGSSDPQVSIVIPVYNKFAYTAACLRSLAAHTAQTRFEVIVVDDLSSDSTGQRLGQIEGIRVLRNAVNLGFVGSCNAGAAMARGEFVLFLNNDTLVTPNWLEALLRCFEDEADAGLVGSRLIYPDGRLQEVGGIIFSDGSGWNYGRFEDPEDTRFLFRREVDYCSGAAIMLRRELFERLGRFDSRYAPAYYEDTDLAFAVRAAGLKVYCEPRSRVVHFEGITAGTDTGTGMKRYQVINQEKFLAKWSSELRAQPRPGTPIHIAASHRATRRILIIDATTPAPDQDSGSLRMVNLMRVLRRNGCHVAFMASNRAWVERYTQELQEIGVEALYHPFNNDPAALFRERGAEFDSILLSRHYVASEFIGLARMYAPRARLVFDTVDLHYLREQRAAELEGRADLARESERTRAQEIGIMRECDVTLVVSPVEKEILDRDAPGVAVDVLSNVHEVFGCRRPFGQRRDLLFVGGFQHPPNTDAVLWFAGAILPLVLQRIPDLHLHVIGSKVTPEIQALASEHLVVHGFVDDIAPAMDSARISIAPLRYGAGVKGKVNMAMSYGLPVVATPMAVEGMHVRAGEDVLVASEAEAFADAIIELYNDESLWNRLSANGLANVQTHFSFDAAEKAIRRIIGF